MNVEWPHNFVDLTRSLILANIGEEYRYYYLGVREDASSTTLEMILIFRTANTQCIIHHHYILAYNLFLMSRCSASKETRTYVSALVISASANATASAAGDSNRVSDSTDLYGGRGNPTA